MESIFFDNAEEGILMMNKFTNTVLKKELPNSTFLPHYYAGDVGGKFIYKNLFENTKYETAKQSLLCHFTSLQGLSSILKNGYLRLSEFSHFSDLNELNFGASIFDNIFLSTEKLNNLVKNQKQNSFALSACMSNDEVIRNSYMWEVYGNSSKGAIIEFEIQNTTVESLLYGKIQYGDKGLKPLKNIFILAKEFHNEHKFFPTNFPIDIKELLAFHKEKKYEDEN